MRPDMECSELPAKFAGGALGVFANYLILNSLDLLDEGRHVFGVSQEVFD